MALLHVDRGELQGDIIRVDQDQMILGRSPDCDVRISTQETVSRWHARIVRMDGQFYIEDHEESRNRTYLNDQKLPYHTPTPLNHQDRIRICEFEATFLDVDADSTIEAMISSKSDHKLETAPAAKLAILIEIMAKLSHTLQLTAQLPAVADGLLRMFPQADRCFLITADEKTGALKPQIAQARVHVDEIKLQFSKTIVNQVLKTGESLLLREGDSLPSTSHSVNLFQIRSVMCTPLAGFNEKPFGVMQLDTQDAGKKFTKDDLHVFSGVANQIAQALENARLHEENLAKELAQQRAKSELQELRLAQELAEERARHEQERARAEQERVKNELDIARNVQLNFLPKKLPDVAGYEFFAFYEAAREVGGDYYDFVRLPGRRLAITVGDVAGKGMPAALLMARLSSESRSCLLTEPDLPAAIAKLNDQLYPFTAPMDRYVTLITAILDPATNTLSLINGGHMTPFHYRWKDRTYVKAVPSEDDGQSLGMDLGQKYQAYTLQFEPGDSLLFYSDGVTDAQNADGKRFGMKGIYKILESNTGSPFALGQALKDGVMTHLEGGLQNDDITLVCFGRPLT